MRPVTRSVLGIALLAALVSASAGPTATEPPRDVHFAAPAGEVVFPHALHADDLGFECTECHHETNARVLDIPHPEYFVDFWLECGVCHGEAAGAPRSCSDCHHDSPASIGDETLSAKVVIHRSCWQCHDAGVGVEASRSCATCHLEPETDGAKDATGSAP